MAYVPPHKRHSKIKDGHAPLPSPQFPPSNSQSSRNRRSLNSRDHDKPIPKLIYATHATCTWFAVGLDDNHAHVLLQPLSLESKHTKITGTPLVLLNTHHPPQGTTLTHTCFRSPAQIITENVLQPLLSAFQSLRNDMQLLQSSQLVKPTLVARFGKILFQGEPSAAQEAVRTNLAAETMLSHLRRSFYTNIPTSYVDKIAGGELPSIGFDFEDEKELFHVKLSDTNHPNATISCKCHVIEDQKKKLHMYKIELNQVRHMVTDISCLVKNLDLRLMLCSKRILTSLTDDELQHIQDLIQAAVLDPNVKGGLRWHLGTMASGGRFAVVGVWHTITKAYRTPSLRLKVRYADRFDFRTSTGESASEVFLKLKGIVSELQVEKVDIGWISKILEERLNLIWDHFLNCEPFLG